MIRYELGRGLAYRRISHPGMHWYTRTLPIIISLLFFSIYSALPTTSPLLGKDGVLSSALSMLSTLPGFYFAGLAAVATFDGLNMDAAMPAPAPQLKIEIGGASHSVDLSRRQFLSYLFSYLVILSFGICAFIVIANAIEPSLVQLEKFLSPYKFGGFLWESTKSITKFAFISAISSMIVTTLHGVYFLTERIHQP